MRKKDKTLKAPGSDFDRNEKFGLSNVPKHFNSVTDDEIDRLKNSVMDEIERTSQFKPGALADVLRSVDGHFESTYSILEGDYGTRLSNLDEVYTRSLTDIRRACDAFALQAVEYNLIFEKYSDANMVINGKKLPKKLMMDDVKIAEIKRIVEDVCERRY